MKNRKRLLSLLLSCLLIFTMVPTVAFAGTCTHGTLDWHNTQTYEHWKSCENPDCDDRNGSITERGNHVDSNNDKKCDVCGVDLINVTFDYEDPSKTDVVVLWAKNGLYIDVNASLVPLDTKEGFVSDGWTLSETKTPAGSLDKSTGQTLMVSDAVYETKWLKYYDEIHFSFTGYELGANVTDGTLTDDIDGYAPLNMPDEVGGKNYAIVADKGGVPDMTDPNTLFKFVTGKFKANTDYWLMVMIGGEGRDITGDIKVDAYDIDDYFLDSPDCVDKYRFAAGEAEFAFFKLKPLDAPTDPTDPTDPSDKPTEDPKDNATQTGDDSNMMMWIMLMVLAAAVGTGAVAFRRKTNA